MPGERLSDKYTLREALTSGFDVSLEDREVRKLKAILRSDQPLLYATCGVLALAQAEMEAESRVDPDSPLVLEASIYAERCVELMGRWHEVLTSSISGLDHSWPMMWPPASTVAIAYEHAEQKVVGNPNG